MYLSDIQIYTKNRYKNTKEEQHLYQKELENNRLQMAYWENIRDLFCIHLPKQFNFLGISKFNIQLGEFSGEALTMPSKDGIALFRRNDFKLSEFKNISENEKNLKSLFYIQDSLITTCDLHNLPVETNKTIKRICSSIKASKFEHFRKYAKTTKWQPSRKFRAVTNLHHKAGGIDVNIDIVNKVGDIVFSECIIKNDLWENVWFALWKSYWSKTTYTIEKRNGDNLCNIDFPEKDVI